MVQAHCIRLRPGEDLVPALEDAARKAMSSANAASAFVLTAVGSLSDVTLRLASASRMSESNETRRWSERFEVVSLVGTFSLAGGKHLHMSVADAAGTSFGGHLVAGTIFTTLELVLGTISNVAFTREIDADTGYSELVVRPMNFNVGAASARGTSSAPTDASSESSDAQVRDGNE